MSANVTEVLAGFAASLQYDDIPERVRDHCKNLLLDTLACAVAGHRGEETQQIAALASGLAQSNESSVIGGEALSLAGATLLNGYLVTAVTMCDVHRPTQPAHEPLEARPYREVLGVSRECLQDSLRAIRFPGARHRAR